MTNDEILQAAKEAGLLHPDAKAASRIVFDLASIIEKRTIEWCVLDAIEACTSDLTDAEVIAAIHKLGEQ